MYFQTKILNVSEMLQLLSWKQFTDVDNFNSQWKCIVNKELNKIKNLDIEVKM